MGVAAALAASLSACNHDANAGAGAGAAPTAAATGPAAAPPPAAPAPAPADDGPKYAKVLSVDPVNQTVSSPREVCRDEVVSHTTPPKDQHRIAGTAIGAVLGGVLGNQVGSGKGRTLATVAGAVGGGYAGNRVEASRQHGQTESSVVRHCSSVANTTTKVVGYDVRYEYKGVTRTVRMDHDPGDRLEVQEGVIAVSDAH
jgi:uncharacterized protein YcfJ